MGKILRTWKIHPFICSVYPILSLFVLNFNSLLWYDIVRILIVTLLSITVIFYLLSKLQKSVSRAALIVSLSSILFFTFRHPLNWMMYTIPTDYYFLSVSVVTAGWVSVWIVGIWFFLRTKKQFENLTYTINIVSLIMVCFLLVQYMFSQGQSLMVKQDVLKTPPQIVTREQTLTPPDIYYIILDSYGRNDIIEDDFNYDNSDFTSRLESLGFVVGANSYSNYGTTIYSVPSSLNLSYLNPVPTSNGSKRIDNRVYRNAVAENYAVRFLRQQGYEIIAIESCSSNTEIKNSDLYIEFQPHLKSVETSLLDNSFAFFFLQDWFLSMHRYQYLNSFESVGEISQRPSPKFVILHSLGLHSPYLFDKTGAPISAGTPNKEKYREQMIYLNQVLEETVSTILANSENEPVIILQGDHGPGGYDFHTDEGIECVEERFKILNAIYFPSSHRKVLYENISPVNIFRLVFNTFLDAKLELLPDVSYYSLFQPPVDFSANDEDFSVCDTVEK